MKTKTKKPCYICKEETDNAIYLKPSNLIINVCEDCEEKARAGGPVNE